MMSSLATELTFAPIILTASLLLVGSATHLTGRGSEAQRTAPQAPSLRPSLTLYAGSESEGWRPAAPRLSELAAHLPFLPRSDSFPFPPDHHLRAGELPGPLP